VRGKGCKPGPAATFIPAKKMGWRMPRNCGVGGSGLLRERKWNQNGRGGTLDRGVEMEGGAEDEAMTVEGTWNLEGGSAAFMQKKA
jgi:hypothetical protein